MNILCISKFDNGGQMQILSTSLNKYTDHDSHHLNIFETFLDYDTDIQYSKCSKNDLQSLINNSDFFIFSEEIPTQLLDLGIINKLNRQNTIIRCYGSVCRKNINNIRKWWSENLITFVSGGLDPTIHPYLGFTVYHIPNMYDFTTFPIPLDKNPIKICHTFTNSKKIKNTDEIINVIDKLKQKHDIESVVINNMSWENSLKIKSDCHITIDQFKLTAYGNSAIESMYLNHAVISNISPLVMSLHPDIPIINTTLDNLYNTLENLISNKNTILNIGFKGRKFALKNHSAKLNIIKWNYLIKWVYEGFK